MNAVFRSVICGGLVCFFGASAMRAQDSAAKPPVMPDSNDPCGNPLMENQLWSSLKGKVSRVIDGRTLLVNLPHNSHPLRVYLAGVGLGNTGQAMEQAKELVSQLVLGKRVEILVNQSWDFENKKPADGSGVVHLENSTAGVYDVGLFLLSKGLVKFQEPAPYSMSRHTECQYKHAEAEAQDKKLGIWVNGG